MSKEIINLSSKRLKLKIIYLSLRSNIIKDVNKRERENFFFVNFFFSLLSRARANKLNCKKETGHTYMQIWNNNFNLIFFLQLENDSV